MLNQQIQETILQVRSSLPKELNVLIEQGAGEISALDILERAKQTGDTMPSFKLLNQNKVPVSLEQLLNMGPLVITFYRGIWCPYCNLQLKVYADHIADIEATGATLIAISPEKPDALALLKESGISSELTTRIIEDTPFDILRDESNALATAMGLVFELPDSHQQLLRRLGVDLETLTGDSSFTFPDPATYVIKPSGEIAWAFVPNNYRKRAEVDQILTALKSL